MRAAGILVMIVAGCGGGTAGPDADFGPTDPVFDEAQARVSITEGKWPGVGGGEAVVLRVESEVSFYLFDDY